MPVILPNAKVTADFNAVVPEAFLRDVVQVIAGIWRESSNENLQIHPKLIKRYRPLHRLAMIETKLESVARRHFNVTGEIRENCVRSHVYTELIIAEKVILTASAVNAPNQLPRRSKFRQKLAAHNPEIRQLNLLEPNVIEDDYNSNQPEANSPLYAVIIHGPSKSQQLEFIKILIPDCNYSFPIASINLLERYSSHITLSGSPTNQIDLSVQEVEKPTARLRHKIEKDIEEDIAANEGNQEGG